MALIELRHVKKEFSGKAGKVTALKDIDLTVESGDIYGIIGYSGAGKSTLVRLLNGLETPTEGEVEIQGQDIALLPNKATSALDPQTTDEVLELLLKINQELNLTVVLITHEMHVIRKICNRVAVMEYGEIVEEGKVIDIFKKPQTEIAKRFIQQEADKNIEETELVVEEMLEQYPNGKIVRLLFHGEQAKLPIISHIVQEYQVEVSIIQGNIQQTKQGAVGSLYIQLLGEEQNILAAIEGLRKLRVETEVIGNE